MIITPTRRSNHNIRLKIQFPSTANPLYIVQHSVCCIIQYIDRAHFIVISSLIFVRFIFLLPHILIFSFAFFPFDFSFLALTIFLSLMTTKRNSYSEAFRCSSLTNLSYSISPILRDLCCLCVYFCSFSQFSFLSACK